MRAVFFFLLAMWALPVGVHAMNFTPSVADVVLTPGEVATLEFQVENTSSITHQYSVSLYGVSFSKETGEPAFSEVGQDVAKWLSFEEDRVELQPGASHAIPFIIAVPPSIEDVTETLAVVVREMTESGGISLAPGVSSLVFLTVGAPRASASISDFSASSLIASHIPITFTASITNSGERVVQPYGIVRVKDIFGRTITSLEFNPSLRRVPQGTTRDFSVQWKEESESTSFTHELWRELTSGVGLFTAELVAAPYPGADPTLQATTRLLVFPWRIAGTACVIGALVYLLVVRKRRSV